MFYYSTNDAAHPIRNYGSDAAQHLLGVNGAKAFTHIEGPDSIGLFLVTFDNGDMLEISRGEQVATGFPVAISKGVPVVTTGFKLIHRDDVKAWLVNALRDNARKGVAMEIADQARRNGLDADAAFNAICADIAFNG